MPGQMFPCQLCWGTHERKAKESNFQALTWQGVQNLFDTMSPPSEYRDSRHRHEAGTTAVSRLLHNGLIKGATLHAAQGGSLTPQPATVYPYPFQVASPEGVTSRFAVRPAPEGNWA